MDRKLARHCGNQKPKLIESDADFFRVIFKSNDKFDATGFEAFYQFRKQVGKENTNIKFVFKNILSIN